MPSGTKAIKVNRRWVQTAEHFIIAEPEKLCGAPVKLRSNTGNGHSATHRFTVKAPLEAAFVAPRDGRNNRDPVALPIRAEPMLAVMVPDLNGFREVRIG